MLLLYIEFCWAIRLLELLEAALDDDIDAALLAFILEFIALDDEALLALAAAEEADEDELVVVVVVPAAITVGEFNIITIMTTTINIISNMNVLNHFFITQSLLSTSLFL